MICTVAPTSDVESASVTVIAELMIVAGSFSVYVIDELFARTGASLTDMTLIVDVATLLKLLIALPSLTCHETVRGAVDGAFDVFEYFTARNAAW